MFGQAVWPATLIVGDRFDEPIPLEPFDRPIQTSRPDTDPTERFDIQHHRMAMLGPGSEAEQDQESWFGRLGSEPFHVSPRGYSNNYV